MEREPKFTPKENLEEESKETSFKLKEYEELPGRATEGAILAGTFGWDKKDYPCGLLLRVKNSEGKSVFQALEKPDEKGGMEVYRKNVIEAGVNILKQPKKEGKKGRVIAVDLPSRSGKTEYVFGAGFYDENRNPQPPSYTLLAKLGNSQYFDLQRSREVAPLAETKIVLIDELGGIKNKEEQVGLLKKIQDQGLDIIFSFGGAISNQFGRELIKNLEEKLNISIFNLEGSLKPLDTEQIVELARINRQGNTRKLGDKEYIYGQKILHNFDEYFNKNLQIMIETITTKELPLFPLMDFTAIIMNKSLENEIISEQECEKEIKESYKGAGGYNRYLEEIEDRDRGLGILWGYGV